MQKWETIYKDTGPVGRVIHFEGISGGDTALCGADLIGDPLIYERDPKPMDNGKVTCPTCIAIVEHCHKIKKTEFKKQ